MRTIVFSVLQQRVRIKVLYSIYKQKDTVAVTMSSRNQQSQQSQGSQGFQSGGGGYRGTGDRADLNNHANQCNPNHSEFRGHVGSFQGSQQDAANHGNQLNPNNPAYQPRK